MLYAVIRAQATSQYLILKLDNQSVYSILEALSLNFFQVKTLFRVSDQRTWSECAPSTAPGQHSTSNRRV